MWSSDACLLSARVHLSFQWKTSARYFVYDMLHIKYDIAYKLVSEGMPLAYASSMLTAHKHVYFIQNHDW